MTEPLYIRDVRSFVLKFSGTRIKEAAKETSERTANGQRCTDYYEDVKRNK